MSITLDLPSDIHKALRVAPEDTERRLKLELAVSLYAQNALGLGKAAELAGMTRLELNEVLAERGIPMHYGQMELEEDLAYGRSRQ